MKQIKIKDIVDYLQREGLQPQLVGDEELYVQGFSSLSKYRPGTFTWVKSLNNLEGIDYISDITLIITQAGLELQASNVIHTPQSKQAFFSVIERFYTEEEKSITAIGSGTYISPKVRLGENVHIGCNCVLDGEITVGDETVIGNNVVITNRVNIGKRCLIQSQVVIGEDGYAYTEDASHQKTMVKHYGGINIGNDVFIGMHNNIARGTIDDAVIEDGVKLAPSNHIGHNVHLGRNSVVICSVLYGSVTIGDNAYVSYSVIRNQCKVGRNSIVGMGSTVTKDIPDNVTVIGSPARIIKSASP